jgi:hypothetical protein
MIGFIQSNYWEKSKGTPMIEKAYNDLNQKCKDRLNKLRNTIKYGLIERDYIENKLAWFCMQLDLLCLLFNTHNLPTPSVNRLLKHIDDINRHWDSLMIDIEILHKRSDCKSYIGDEEEYIDPIFNCVNDPPPFVHTDDYILSDGAILRDLFKK